MIYWIVGIYLLIGIIAAIWALIAEPKFQMIGNYLIAVILISVIIWPYVLYCLIYDYRHRRWFS